MKKSILIYGSNRNGQKEVKEELRNDINDILRDVIANETLDQWETIEACSFYECYGEDLLQRQIINNVEVAYIVANKGLIGIKTAFYTGLLKASRTGIDYSSPDIFILPMSEADKENLSEQELDNYQDLYEEVKPYDIYQDDGLRFVEVIRSHCA